ncbi:Ldb7p KNAG_0C02920 [Huiozyma naganishii CBS 8797]|uniref:Uncharacterized protein n=1 Tax=Huiozyma naganishii (strain ATCC MYA-139 / BCRC 22969 / CBS 8797 / KCTC 17520 / NBRC 10181 / NCYC 3082 / Yp74L-3) TaxID=1071383 RepID=J7RIQ4_HUIN7|nr:hypothetical protein KNAG_0C02920 [Kazachstania naganishii CBS 8797]CCK69403.1 hypothetical protein KNAG_0C02920 [Kazachstania naganishii CBS 8797]
MSSVDTTGTVNGNPHENPGTVEKQTKRRNNRSYYDIISALSAVEKSQDVVFTPEELVELTAPLEQGRSNDPQSDTKKDGKPRINVHGYMGDVKVNPVEASKVEYDLSHTLLGGYVPRKQLESLSSVDFAHYFHKALECENTLQIYDMFVPQKSAMHQVLAGRLDHDTTQQNQQQQQQQQQRTTYQRVDAAGRIVKKVLVCKRCSSKFQGPHRWKQLKQHVCKTLHAEDEQPSHS